MPPLADFMESLIQEKDKLVKMGTIKYSKDQSLDARVLDPANGKKKKRSKRNLNLQMGVRTLARRRTRRSKKIPNAHIVTRCGIQRVHV